MPGPDTPGIEGFDLDGLTDDLAVDVSDVERLPIPVAYRASRERVLLSGDEQAARRFEKQIIADMNKPHLSESETVKHSLTVSPAFARNTVSVSKPSRKRGPRKSAPTVGSERRLCATRIR